jgi:AraC-like DNA-binding protein
VSFPRSSPEHLLESSTSSVLALGVLLDAYERAGGKRAAVLRRIGLPAAELAHPEGRIPFDALLHAWEMVPALLGDDDFGLRMGGQVQRGSFGLVEYLARASATVGEAIQRLVEFQRLLHDRARIVLLMGEGTATISARIAGLPLGGPRHFNEATVSILLAMTREMTGKDIAPVEVMFQHPEPASTAVHRSILRAPVRFGGTQNHLVLPASVLSLPLREADPALARVLVVCAQRALERLPPISDGMRICRELVATQLAAGNVPRIGYIAREVGLSPRSLQRILADHGVSFRDVVDDVRKELALVWAASTSEHAAQIAYRLGYADASAFHHAFRRWTGQTVTQFRTHARQLRSA